MATNLFPLICYILLYSKLYIKAEGHSDSDISDIRIMLNRFNETIAGMSTFVAETNNRLEAIDEMLQQSIHIPATNNARLMVY